MVFRKRAHVLSASLSNVETSFGQWRIVFLCRTHTNTMNLLPPPIDDSYESLHEAIIGLNRHAAAQGYAIVKTSSKRRLGQPYRVYIGCDRHGRPRDGPLDRQRQGASRAVGCPWSGLFRYAEGLWRLELRSTAHNHGPSDPIGHPVHRRLPEEALAHIDSLSRANAPPRAIVSSLRQGTGDRPPLLVPPITRDVYNARAALRLGTLGGRTPIQALMEALQGSDDWTERHRLDPTGRVVALFLAHKRSIELLQGALEVLVLDCTYKTNRFRMPLFVMTGVSALGATFHVALAFLSQERQCDYEWALAGLRDLYESGGLGSPRTLATDRDLGLMSAIREIFPRARNVLCLWHVAKNVLARCKRHFPTGDDWTGFLAAWQALLASPTPEDYDARLSDFRTRYCGLPALPYLERTWLPYKEALVLAWTNRALHLGLTTTSRVEGAHSALKTYLQVSTGDLHAVVGRIELLIDNQTVEARAAKARALTRIGGDLRIPLFVELIGVASPVGLRLIVAQRRKLAGDPPAVADPCTGVFRTTMGLPCAHELGERLRAGGTLSLRDLHPYWLLDRSQALPDAIDPALLVRDPPVAVPKGRPRGALGGTRSTRRDPSLFEVVEGSTGVSSPRATPCDREPSIA